MKMEFLSSFSKRSDESRQIGAKTQTDVPSRILFLWTTAQFEQEIASLVRMPRIESSLDLSSVDVMSVTVVRMTVARQSLNRTYNVSHQRKLRRHKLKGP